jgi:hypothetical protein
MCAQASFGASEGLLQIDPDGKVTFNSKYSSNEKQPAKRVKTNYKEYKKQ